MKYKVGEKVRVKKDLEIGKRYYNESGEEHDAFVTGMEHLRGEVVTISKADGKYLIEESGYNWVDEMFESVRKFKEGDVVVGTNDRYFFTNTKSINKVVGYNADGKLIIRVLNADSVGCDARTEFKVEEKDFELKPKVEKKVKKAKIKEEKVMKFEVGDIVTGKKGCEAYCITTEHMTKGLITEISSKGSLTIKVIEHSKYPREVGQTFPYLNPECFKLVKEEPKVVAEPEVYKKVDNDLNVTFIKVGRLTICCAGEIGIATRHPEDKEVEEVGEALAFKRLCEKI